MSRLSVVWSLVVAVLLLLGTLLIANASGVGPGIDATPKSPPQYPELTGPDVITYDVSHLPSIRNAKRVLHQGTQRPDGSCNYSYQSPLVRPGDPVPAARLLALDVATCRYLIEQGEYTGPLPDAAQRPTPIRAVPPRDSAGSDSSVD